MKIYNITDTDRFFRVLSDCRGDVEIIGKDGSAIPFNKDDNARIIEEMSSDITIHEMELHFSDPKDCVNMILYLGNFKAA